MCLYSLFHDDCYKRKPKKKQLLTVAMKKKRFNWEKNKDWSEDDWSCVLFSEKSYFFAQGFNPKFVCCSTNEKLRQEHFVKIVKRPDKKMFWGCFSINGPESLLRVEGMMNSKAYLQIIKKKVC